MDSLEKRQQQMAQSSFDFSELLLTATFAVVNGEITCQMPSFGPIPSRLDSGFRGTRVNLRLGKESLLVAGVEPLHQPLLVPPHTVQKDSHLKAHLENL